MAITVKEFSCAVDSDTGEPAQSSYTFNDIPLTGEVIAVTYKNLAFLIAIRGDHDITLLNPGGSRTFRPIAANGTPPALSTFIGHDVVEVVGAIRYWFQDAL